MTSVLDDEPPLRDILIEETRSRHSREPSALEAKIRIEGKSAQESIAICSVTPRQYWSTDMTRYRQTWKSGEECASQVVATACLEAQKPDHESSLFIFVNMHKERYASGTSFSIETVDQRESISASDHGVVARPSSQFHDRTTLKLGASRFRFIWLDSKTCVRIEFAQCYVQGDCIWTIVVHREKLSSIYQALEFNYNWRFRPLFNHHFGLDRIKAILLVIAFSYGIPCLVAMWHVIRIERHKKTVHEILSELESHKPIRRYLSLLVGVFCVILLLISWYFRDIPNGLLSMGLSLSWACYVLVIAVLAGLLEVLFRGDIRALRARTFVLRILAVLD